MTDTDPEQRCYAAFVAAIGDAVRCASPALVDDDSVSHEHMLSGLASAHIHGIASVVASCALVTGQPADRIAESMIVSLRERIDELMREGTTA